MWSLGGENGSHGEVEIETTDGSCGRQKEYDFLVLVHGGTWPGSRRRALYHGHSVLGRRSMDREVESRTKRSVDEANSRSSHVETGERAGAVMCEILDLGIKWPHWHILMFSD